MPPGDRIIVVVQKQRSFGAESPGSSSLGITNKVRRGDIRHAVVVRAKKEVQRKDGGLIRFDDNACVLINKTGDPIGTRLTSMSLYSHCLSELLYVYRCGWSRATRQAVVEDTIARTITCIRNEMQQQQEDSSMLGAVDSSWLRYNKHLRRTSSNGQKPCCRALLKIRFPTKP